MRHEMEEVEEEGRGGWKFPTGGPRLVNQEAGHHQREAVGAEPARVPVGQGNLRSRSGSDVGTFLHSISLIFGDSREAIVTERERERS